ncbi:hypothetical protein CLAIMM_11820 [Cladophialophora immunda]|nr:hypothetical protein CLAIMM_11820 [Cladophialophora immunda]
MLGPPSFLPFIVTVLSPPTPQLASFECSVSGLWPRPAIQQLCCVAYSSTCASSSAWITSKTSPVTMQNSFLHNPPWSNHPPVSDYLLSSSHYFDVSCRQLFLASARHTLVVKERLSGFHDGPGPLLIQQLI